MTEFVTQFDIALPSQKVLAVAFSPDGTRIAAGDRDGVIHIIDPENGAVLRKLKQHVEFVYALAFDPDSGHLVSGGKDKSLREWDIESGTFLRDYTGIFQGGAAARTMAAQSCRQTSNGHTMTVLSIACAGRGLMATSGQDRRVKLWKNGNAVRTYDWHSEPVPCVRFQPGTDILFSASKDRTVRSWNEETGAVIHKYTGHDTGIVGLEFVDENTFLSVDASGQVYAWLVDDEKPARALYLAPRRLSCARKMPGRDVLVVGSEDGALEAVDIQKGTELAGIRLHTSQVRCIDVDARGRIASCDNSGHVCLSTSR